MTTMISCDVTAKRASSSGLLAVDEEKFDSSLMKKQKVDEEDDDGYMETETESEGDGVVESEGSRTFEGYRGLVDIPEPEPEWDVDSFDGREYESDPEVRDSFDNENDYLEFREDRIQALKNRGFLPDLFNFIGPIQNLDGPACRNMTNREYLAGLASMCVEKLNKNKGKTVEFVRIVRATMTAGSSWKLYITFLAREYPNGPLVEYQAKAMDFAGEYRPPFPILCRPAPKTLI